MLRKENGLTQDELANHLGVSKQSIYKWKKGRSTPDGINMKIISNYFHVRMDDLVSDIPLEEIRKGGNYLLNHNEKKNIKKYINVLPIIGVLMSIILFIYFVFILKYDVNLPLIVYVLLPIIVLAFMFFLPFKIIENRRKKEA